MCCTSYKVHRRTRRKVGQSHCSVQRLSQNLHCSLQRLSAHIIKCASKAGEKELRYSKPAINAHLKHVKYIGDYTQLAAKTSMEPLLREHSHRTA